MKNRLAVILLVSLLLLSGGDASPRENQPVAASLEAGFDNPPLSARPRAYWAWMNGNVSLTQLTRDLEEMKDKGISGLDIFDIGARDPKGVVPEGVAFLGKESMEAIGHAVREAGRLGLELGLLTSSSWNAGGPWVEPKHAMMALYKSETQVKGPQRFRGILPFPDVPGRCPRGPDGLPLYYRDVVVLAVPVGADSIIPDTSSVLGLTSLMAENGELVWNVPAGKWTIMRLVCTNTGQQLVLPSPKSAGLIIDHFNPEATEMHFQYIIDRLKEELGDIEGSALKMLYLPSYEVTGLVWTPRMAEEFRMRRGYDLTKYLPILFGMKIRNDDITGRFRFDFNMTLSDLIIEAHYVKAREISNRNGMLLCSEAGGPGQPLHNCPFEALRALGSLDIPRGEFWNKHQRFDAEGNDILWLVKEIACASHIYGKKLVDGEAFTSWQHWQEGPFELKPLADRAMCEGLNLFTFHTGAHNPPEAGKPGWAYHAGTHINVNRVWWPKIKPFMSYLARSSFLLQSGLFVGDVLYFYGDEAPNFVKPKHDHPTLGPGFDYDVTNSEVILNRLNVKDGKLVLPDGMSYEILVLPEREDMNADVLKRLTELVRKGATVIGPKPSRSNGLNEYQERDSQIRRLADELWGMVDGKSVLERPYGDGKIVWGKKLRDVLAERGVGPDFTFEVKAGDGELDFIHRRTERGEDIYFVVNKSSGWTEADCRFRVDGKSPELWYPDTGERMEYRIFRSGEGSIEIPLRLAPYGSVFVVFREDLEGEHIISCSKNETGTNGPDAVEFGDLPESVITFNDIAEVHVTAWRQGTYILETSAGRTIELAFKEGPVTNTVEGPWEVRFPFGWGAPPVAEFPELISWTRHRNEGIKYFSGIARYLKDFEIPESLVSPDMEILLDLGMVGLVADVFLNGIPLGILWKPPFRLDITDAAIRGTNHLEIEVANVWNNRIVGDASRPEGLRYTNTNIAGPLSSRLPWKDAELVESGLLGPVRILAGKKQVVKLR